MSHAATTPATDLTGDYTVDPAHSRLGFSARHAMVTKVHGQFGDFTGTAHVDADDPAASSVSLSIEVAAVSTGNADRDAHLASPDFFDAARYPTITFVSTDVSREGTEWSITGDLTIKDVTRSVTLVFEEAGVATDPFGNVRAGFEARATLNRKDWGLTWNAALETGGVLVSDKIALELDVSAVRA